MLHDYAILLFHVILSLGQCANPLSDGWNLVMTALASVRVSISPSEEHFHCLLVR